MMNVRIRVKQIRIVTEHYIEMKHSAVMLAMTKDKFD